MKYTNGTLVQFQSIVDKDSAEIQQLIRSMIESIIESAKNDFTKHFPCTPYAFKTESVSNMLNEYSSTLFVTLVYTITYN